MTYPEPESNYSDTPTILLFLSTNQHPYFDYNMILRQSLIQGRYDVSLIAKSMAINLQMVSSEQDPLIRKDEHREKRKQNTFYLLSGRALQYQYPNETCDAILFLDDFWFPIYWDSTDRNELIQWMINPLRDHSTCDCCFKSPRFGLSIFCGGCGLSMCLRCAFQSGYGKPNEFGNIGFECTACSHRDVLGSGHWYFVLLDQIEEMDKDQKALLTQIMHRDRYRRLRINAWNERKRLKPGIRVLIEDLKDKRLDQQYGIIIEKENDIYSRDKEEGKSDDYKVKKSYDNDDNDGMKDMANLKGKKIRWKIHLENERRHKEYGKIWVDEGALNVQCTLPRRKAKEKPRNFMHTLHNKRDEWYQAWRVRLEYERRKRTRIRQKPRFWI